MLLLLHACSGASTSASEVGTVSGPFELSSISVSNGQIWQINRPITFSFTAPVDFSTVSLNTFAIRESSGVPAIGEFTQAPGAPNTIHFQPACPTRADLSDAGFRPGGVTYLVSVPTVTLGIPTVRSATGDDLVQSFGRQFTTPASGNPAALFLDPIPGPPRPVLAPGLGTSLVLGEGGASDEVFFSQQPDGSGGLPSGVLVPSNYHSEPASRFFVNLRFDQPVSPSSENLHEDRLRIEYQSALGGWIALDTDLELETNCTGTGASVRMMPVGVMPRGRPMRLVVTAEFEDLVGERNASALETFALMTADFEADRNGLPVEMADEFLEQFLDPAFQDTTSQLSASPAVWGPDGLQAAFAFDGTGGPGGEFDLHVLPNTTLTINTTQTLLTGGPKGVPLYSQLSVNGRVDVRNLYVPSSSTLRIAGPNPVHFMATGTVTIDGLLTVDGGNSVTNTGTFTPTIPEPGAPGTGGGGDGGTGSPNTVGASARGGTGQGAFNLPNGGGQGGESGWNPGGQPALRRAAGGGGGRLGHDQAIRTSSGTLCDDQLRVGLDAESGFPGALTAFSAVDNGMHWPYGGRPGPGVFGQVAGIENDFLGSILMNVGKADEQLITGELTGPTPGSGGGAGGDSILTSSYPPLAFVPSNHRKGAGGGGGAGAITIQALGDIVIGSGGRISAAGGHGNGGANTAGINRIGGGSGGGSGGHIILETAGRLDLRAVNPSFPALDAKGGQGGVGANNVGGAAAGETPPYNDAMHVGSNNGQDNPWLIIPVECSTPPVVPAGQTLVVNGAGGDGGPGLIQVHVTNLQSDILYPENPSAFNDERDIRLVSSPVPHGYDSINESWRDQLLLSFGRYSTAQSKWLALGETAVEPQSSTPQEIDFLFAGTHEQTGQVTTNTGLLAPQEALLSAVNLQLDGSDPTHRTAWLDAGSLLGGSDEIYLRNPNLLRNFNLIVIGTNFNVAAASYDEATERFSVVVNNPGPTLPSAAGTADLVPRYFGITTGSLEGFLPPTAGVAIEFDLKAERHDEASGFPEPITTGFQTNLQAATGMIDQSTHAIRFLRYRVTFDIGIGGATIHSAIPRPTLDFLRIPFRF